MEPVITVVAMWGLFIATHMGLATSPVRGALVARLGDVGFLLFFGIVASILFAALVAVFAEVRHSGPPGLALGTDPLVRGLLIVMVVAGFVLIAGALGPRGYRSSPMAVLSESVRPPIGLDRITRDPFFSGTVLVAGSHALLAAQLTGTVFFAGFALLAIAGPLHQGTKLRALRGEAYNHYLAQTSAIPFAAIAAGRQRFVASEMPWGAFAAGLVAAAALRLGHDHLFDAYGAPFTLMLVGGSTLVGVMAIRRRVAK